MKTKIVVGITMLAAAALAGSVPANAGGGSDVGNGGNGGSTLANVMPMMPMPWRHWCNAVSGMLTDTLMWADSASTMEESRQFMVESLRNILASYQGGELRYQPLTYSLLSTALQINQVFPRDMLADQSAVVTLHHLIASARIVNTNFDVPRFVPWAEVQTQRPGCGRGCPELPISGPIYVDGISAIRVVLSDLFSPALVGRPHRGSVLDAMGTDEWELKAVSALLTWIERTFEGEMFNRQFECLRSQTIAVHARLDRYLSGVATAPFDSRMMRGYVESSLLTVLLSLDSYDYSEYRCGRR